jgi:hypothetical protein
MIPMMFKVPGHDFILNHLVLEDKKIPLQDRVEYAGLCSLRNYEDYVENGILYLHKDLIPPWVPHQILESNSLIENHTNHITLLGEQKSKEEREDKWQV